MGTYRSGNGSGYVPGAFDLYLIKQTGAECDPGRGSERIGVPLLRHKSLSVNKEFIFNPKTGISRRNHVLKGA